jgi:hypothetical protein
MSEIGNDIKEVFEEVGTGYAFSHEGVQSASGEFLVYEINAQVTKPFVREYFLECEVPWDSGIGVGDHITFDDARNFLCMNKTPEHFENEVILFQAVLYKTNVIVDLFRSSGEDWDANYLRAQNWHPIQTSLPVLITESLYGHDLETDEELGQIGLENHEMYIPSWVGVEILDRVEWTSGEFYQVETIKARRYEGMDVVELGEDTR